MTDEQFALVLKRFDALGQSIHSLHQKDRKFMADLTAVLAEVATLKTATDAETAALNSYVAAEATKDAAIAAYTAAVNTLVAKLEAGAPVPVDLQPAVDAIKAVEADVAAASAAAAAAQAAIPAVPANPT
jgi:hypothetical protein